MHPSLCLACKVKAAWFEKDWQRIAAKARFRKLVAREDKV
jgi:hypothetical protein